VREWEHRQDKADDDCRQTLQNQLMYETNDHCTKHQPESVTFRIVYIIVLQIHKMNVYLCF
jgi:hypothetical protein